MRRLLGISALFGSTLIALAAPAAGIQVRSAEARLSFPDQIEFILQADSSAPIRQVTLEYGLDLTACATAVNLATPEDFTPGSTTVNTSWTWDMRQTGSLPPGAQLWWRWHLVADDGTEVKTDTQQVTWIDSEHAWQSLQAEGLVLHWYAGPRASAQKLLDAGVAAERRLNAELGKMPGGEVQLYIYDSNEAMRAAVLFEPGWSGGLAFPEHRIVILGISQAELDWGMGAVAHELAHVVVGNLVNHCYSSLPSWLDEGLAMVAEGGLDPGSQGLLDQAVADNTLFSVRALSDSFTEDPGRASLSYAQAYSLVSFLLKRYGQQKMLDLLSAFQAGYRYDHALQQVYGFDADGLEAAWRADLGARVIPTPSGTTATPTEAPTLVPIGAPPAAATATPQPILPSSQSGGGPIYRQLEPLFQAVGCGVILVPLACLAGFLAVVVVAVVVARRAVGKPPGSG